MEPEAPLEQEPPAEVKFPPEVEAVQKELTEKISKKISARQVADIIGNATFFVDAPKMLAEAIYGTTFGGKKLSSREKRAYAAVAGFLTVAYGLQMSGMTYEAVAVGAFSKVIGGIELGPNLAYDAIDWAKDKAPHLVPYLEKTATFLADKQPLVAETARNFRNFVTSNPDLVLLNLH